MMELGVICHRDNGIEVFMLIELREERVELEENLNLVTLGLCPVLFISPKNVSSHK
jgi:hypothetical protein